LIATGLTLGKNNPHLLGPGGVVYIPVNRQLAGIGTCCLKPL